MFHTGFSKEYLSVPFVRNDTGEEHLVLLYKELSGRDCSKFIRTIGLYNLIDDVPYTNIDFNIVVQRLSVKEETNLAFHTWILKNINKNMHMIPNDKSVDVSANFKYTICSLLPHINPSVKSCFVESNLKICYSKGNVMFLPLNVCKFVLNDSTQPFYVLVSIARNMTAAIKENNVTCQREFNRCSVTLHILIDSNYKLVNLDEISNYLKHNFKICL